MRVGASWGCNRQGGPKPNRTWKRELRLVLDIAEFHSVARDVTNVILIYKLDRDLAVVEREPGGQCGRRAKCETTVRELLQGCSRLASKASGTAPPARLST